MTDALGNVTEYGFDASGNMVTQEDALHRMRHYEFDVTGRRTARASKGAAIARASDMGYDPARCRIIANGITGKTMKHQRTHATGSTP